jgi:PAS domain S-box-containing protein
MGRILDKWLALGLVLIVAVLVLSGGLALRNTMRLNEDAAAVASAQQVLDLTAAVLRTLLDAQTGQRGFLLTGKEKYLEPYDEATKQLDGLLAALADKATGNPARQERIARLKESARARLDWMQQAIALRRASAAKAEAFVNSDQGKAQMDEFRQLIADAERADRDLIQTRQLRTGQAYLVAQSSALLCTTLGLAMVAAFYWLLHRSLTARMQAAALLYEQRQWLQTILKSIGDGVLATDTEGRLTFLNPVAQTLTGWREEEAKGERLSTVFQIVNEDTRQPVANPVLRALQEGAIVGLTNHTLLIARNGIEQPIDDSAAPIRDEQGQVLGAVMVFRDVTERRRAEQALRDVDRRKDEFLATLAHELRNPLAPVRNAVELLRLSADDPASLQKARQIMERQLGQMVRLVDDLSDISRISRGKLRLRKETVELATTVQSALEETRPLIEACGHQLTISLPPGPVYLDADPSRLTQVFSNLLNNAAKYTNKGGRIWLSADAVNREVRVSVRDTGIGFAPERLPELFKMFSQGDPGLERSQGGLGIGLALVRGLVELHGGAIEAHSDGVGLGSEFVIRLPVLKGLVQRAPRAEPGDVEEPLPASPSKCRILVVDDNVDSATSLAMILRRMGHDTQTAFDGLEAVQAAAAFQPQVVLLDIGLPKMNGYEAARRIRQQRWEQKLAIIALTGWGQEKDKQMALDAGFDHHLTKPVEPVALERLLALISPATRETH